MKKIFIFLFITILSSNMFAFDVETATATFHERMVERNPQYFDGATVSLAEEVPEEVQAVIAYHFLGLVNFAIDYDLFSIGWGYKLNDNVYEVKNPDGLIIAYTFSATISKNEVFNSIGFYQLDRRIDGVFYLSRDPTWYE